MRIESAYDWQVCKNPSADSTAKNGHDGHKHHRKCGWWAILARKPRTRFQVPRMIKYIVYRDLQRHWTGEEKYINSELSA
jgi:hypothetical protein